MIVFGNILTGALVVVVLVVICLVVVADVVVVMYVDGVVGREVVSLLMLLEHVVALSFTCWLRV